MKNFFSPQKAAVRLIRLYQASLSPDSGYFSGYPGRRVCAMYPSCSEYAALAIEKYGMMRGCGKALARILRCHPWRKEYVDMP